MVYTVGQYLATRLAQLGLNHIFAVAGDYNLVLLDELGKVSELEQVYCSNELNCGFAAEGHARARGLGAAVVTFSVGAFSAFNSVGGATAENLPLILISGAPNSNDYGSGHILHHTTGHYDYSYQMEMAKYITVAAVSVTRADTAPALIDHAIRQALYHQKAAYIELSCNIVNLPCAAPGPISSLTYEKSNDTASLEAAAKACLDRINHAKNPVIIVGNKTRAAGAEKEVIAFAKHLGCAVATMAHAKSFFPENDPHYIGTFWGEISSPGVDEYIKNSDCRIYIGAVFNDYSTVGWTSHLINEEHDILLSPRHLRAEKTEFSGFTLKNLLKHLTPLVKKNSAGLETFKSQAKKEKAASAADGSAPLTMVELTRQIQGIINNKTTLFLDTGDSWFHGMHYILPEGARVESEMQWGHIGWSIPSIFGYAVGLPERRNVVMVGDGSFQLTAQEVAQMIRRNLHVIIILINNRGYTIEVKIHDGPYNRVKNWDYANIIHTFNAEDGHGIGFKAKNGAELAKAMKAAVAHKQGPVLIEVEIDPQDCSPDLVVWGKKVAKANARPPHDNK